MRVRYSAWDGSQDPFGPDLPAADVLEAISDDVLMGASADSALQRLMRNGMQGRCVAVCSASESTRKPP